MSPDEQPASSPKTPDRAQGIQTRTVAMKEQAEKEQAEREQAETEQAAPKDSIDRAAKLFWPIFAVIVLIFFLYSKFAPGNQALIFLEASPTQPLQISGAVMFKGAPLSKGTISLVFDDPKKNQYLAGTILSIDEGGKFTVSGPELEAVTASEEGPNVTSKTAESRKPLRVAAEFSGQTQEEEKGKTPTTPTAVTGNATLYLNCSPPVSKQKFWGSLIIMFGVGTYLVTMFTGQLTQRKARLLFSTSYIVIFLSLALPIYGIVLVSRSPDAIELMQQAAIGLVKGTASTIPTPQWLLNLGGAVSPAAKELPTGTEASQPNEGLKARVPNESVVPVSPNRPQQQSATFTKNDGTDEALFRVRGGLAVPFYVVFLAMLGAGINMTKKVPDIQRRHDTEPLQKDERTLTGSVMAAVLKPSDLRPKTEQEITTTFEIRKELIDNYMGLISAPFLAIAVYYLLQVVATNVAEPVLVVVSFATGFISDSIVTRITSLATEWIAKKASEDAKEKAAKEQAEKEQAAKEEAEKEEAAKEQAAKGQAAKEKAAKEQAAKEKAAKEQAAKEQAEKEQAEREQGANE